MQCNSGWPLAVDDGKRFQLFHSVMVKIGRHRPIYADLPPLLTRNFFASLRHLRRQTFRRIACPFPFECTIIELICLVPEP
jgi:hypothetical protein